MTTFFTSDWHFGHVNILTHVPARREYLGLSPEADVNDMNDALVELWNRQVKPTDDVWVIGDMCMGKVAETITHVGRLNGHKYLIMGNHDRPHPVATKNPDKRAEWHEMYKEYFDGIHMDMIYDFDGIEIEVNHFPFPGNDHTSGSERYNATDIAEWSPVDVGQPLVHGHVHDHYKVRDKMLNVGIDAWDGQMFTTQQIGTYFRSQDFTGVD